MNTEKSGPDTADLLRQLESKNQAEVLKALDKLAKSGSIKELPAIIKVMANLRDLNLIHQFTEFLANIKSKGAPAVMVKYLADPSCATIRTELMRACWESQLDYSPHLILFARLFITGDYVEATEAFTVIESSCEDRTVSIIVIAEIISLVRNSLPDMNEEKKRLSIELISALESLRGTTA